MSIALAFTDSIWLGLLVGKTGQLASKLPKCVEDLPPTPPWADP